MGEFIEVFDRLAMPVLLATLGTPLGFRGMLDSALLQATWSVVWSVLGFGAMWLAARRLQRGIHRRFQRRAGGDQFLDSPAQAARAGSPAFRAERIALAQRQLAPLLALPDNTPLDEVLRRLDAIGTATDESAVRAALLERANGDAPSRLDLIALILHTTDGRLIEVVGGDGPTFALAALTAQATAPDLIALFARRLTAALDEDPELWGPSPSVSRLQEVLETYADTEADLPLRTLIAATNRAAPEDGLA